jgi:hypothetical protein
MNELIDTQPDINIQEAEYKRLLGYPNNYKLEGRAQMLADWAREWYTKNGNPWIYALQLNNFDFSGNNLRIEDKEFLSKKLRKQFSQAGVNNAMLLAVSAGNECEDMAHRLWEEEKPDEYFFLEVYGSAVVEHLITTTGFRFCEWAEKNNMTVLPHYSPGYPGWNVEDQHQLLRLINEKKTVDLPGDICVLETGMLKPKKSMLALFGITKEVNKARNLKELVPCQICSLQACQYRRVPYNYSRPQLEDVHNLQPGRSQVSNGNGFTPLTSNANYSVSLTALQRWYQERLKFKILDDSSVEATFKYEGTTCSNMGRALNFDYHIKLSSAIEGYKIKSLSCNPSSSDDGCTYMCEYIKDSESLMEQIKNEKPLLEKSLDDVLKWKRRFSPEGCYCNYESRQHKWGLALEVLHFALIQLENKKISDREIKNNFPEYKL